MKHIAVKDLKAGMQIYEEPGHIKLSVVYDAQYDRCQNYDSAIVVIVDTGETAEIGAERKHTSYGPDLYLIEEGDPSFTPPLPESVRDISYLIEYGLTQKLTNTIRCF